MGAGAIEDLVCGLWGIRKPRLYGMGFVHNNCGGMCVRAGQGQFAMPLDKRPALYMKHEAKNETVRKEIARRARERIAAGTLKAKAVKDRRAVSSAFSAMVKPNIFTCGNSANAFSQAS